MKRMLWVIALVSLVSGAAAFFTAYMLSCGCRAGNACGLDDISALAARLDLDEGQTVEIARIHSGLVRSLKDYCAWHCAARRDLVAALGGENPDHVRAERILEDMCSEYAAGERAAVHGILRMRGILDAEQRRCFDALLAGSVCGSGVENTREGEL